MQSELRLALFDNLESYWRILDFMSSLRGWRILSKGLSWAPEPLLFIGLTPLPKRVVLQEDVGAAPGMSY